jgi:hypothetical protein
MEYVFVTNTNPGMHQDRYDGDEYFFPPGEAVQLSVPAAAHMLGYGLKDKSEVMSRLGLAFSYNPGTKAFTDHPDGVRWLAKFLFEEAVVRPKSALALALEKLPSAQAADPPLA